MIALPCGNSAISTRCGYASAPKRASISASASGCRTSGTPSAAAAAWRVWSSGVAPTPPNANTMSPRANDCRSASVSRSRSSPSKRAHASASPRAVSVAVTCAKWRSCRLPVRISSPMTTRPMARLTELCRDGLGGGELLVDLLHHRAERAVDQRLGLDQPRAVGAEALGELVGRHRQRLLALAVGEEIRAAQWADPRELRERELAVVGLELDPDAALEALRDLEELVVDDLGHGLGRRGLRLRHRRGERLGLRRGGLVAGRLRVLRLDLRLLGDRHRGQRRRGERR